MITRILLILSTFALVAKQCESSNILVVAPFFAKSHSIFVHSVMTHLAKKGHNVTIITTNVEKNPPPNYTQIPVIDKLDLGFLAEEDIFTAKNLSIFQQLHSNWGKSSLFTDAILSTGTIKNFIDHDSSQFDLVIVEYFHQEHMYMFSHKYKAPLALISSSTYNQHVFEIMGSYLPLSYVPHDQYKSGSISNLYQRVLNTVAYIYAEVGRNYYYMAMQERMAQKHFSSWPQPLPTLKELEKNIVLAMFNTHFACDLLVPSVPGIVEIGGAHIKTAKQLPEDLKKFLDSATDGAIVFALGGSHLKSSEIHPEKLKAFIKAFEEVNLKVVWKWEDDRPPKDKNIYTSKWLPIYDVLGHPNVKAFINHGGKLSLLEAMYQGVPVIGIPIFADQPVNLANLVEKGAAVIIDYNEIETNMMKEVLRQVTLDPSYKISATKIAEKMRDRQNDPLESAAYWVNYVLKHKDMNILKSPQFNMPWYVYYMVDVLAVLSTIFVLFFILIIVIVKLFKTILCKQKDLQVKKVNDKQKKNK